MRREFINMINLRVPFATLVLWTTSGVVPGFAQPSAQPGFQSAAEASRALAGSLEYAVTLQTVAELAVPLLGDVCLIDLVDEQGAIFRAAVAHAGGPSVVLAQIARPAAGVRTLSSERQCGRCGS